MVSVRTLALLCLCLPAFGAYNGTLTGSPTFGTPAKFGEALTATSDSNYISLPTGVFGNITGSSSWTVEAQLKLTGTSTYVAVSSGNNTFNIWFGASNDDFAVSVYGTGAFSSGAKLDSGIAINDGNFHHCAVVMTGGTTITTYVDGNAGASFTGQIIGVSVTTGMIGRFGSSGFSWPGSIDEVAIWNTNKYTSSFTPPSAPYTGSESGLQALYHLDDNALDSSGNTIAQVSNTNWYFSPYSWQSNGGGSLQSNNVNASSTQVQTNDAGAYFKVDFTGTSATLVVNESQMDSSWPVLKWSIDAGPWQSYTTNGSDSTVTLATGLASQTHTLLFYFQNSSGSSDQWTTPAQSLIITGMQLDSGAALAAPTKDVSQLSNNAVFFGDSITAGYYVNGYNSNSTLTSDAQLSWTYGVAQALGAEYGNVAFGCLGWSTGGCSGSNVPAFPSSWNLYWSGTSRLVSGKLSPVPNYVVVNLGQNDGSTNIQSTVESWITSARAAVSASTPIILIVPFSQNQAADLVAAAAASGDSHVYVVNLGTTIMYGLNGTPGPSRWTADGGGIHPYGTTDGWLGAMVAHAIQVKTTAVAGSSSYVSVQ
jgi:lysophospholipase L1-like esterase